VRRYVLNDPLTTEVDISYRECLMTSRQDLIPQPFGDVPLNLALDLTSSLRLVRTLLQFLDIASNVVNVTAGHWAMDDNCSQVLGFLRLCLACQGSVSDSLFVASFDRVIVFFISVVKPKKDHRKV